MAWVTDRDTRNHHTPRTRKSYAFIHSFIHPFIHSSIHPFIHLFIYVGY